MQTIRLSLIAAVLVAMRSAAVLNASGLRATPGGSVERGRYLVGAAGQCADCHGGRYQGSALDFLNPALPPAVARKAPKIAGLPMFHDEAAAVRFLQTGQLPDGKSARPPMPQYRFSNSDATAIVAYLKTLR